MKNAVLIVKYIGAGSGDSLQEGRLHNTCQSRFYFSNKSMDLSPWCIHD